MSCKHENILQAQVARLQKKCDTYKADVDILEEKIIKANDERNALERQLQEAALFTGMRLSCNYCPINCDSTGMTANKCMEKLREHWRLQAEVDNNKVQCKNCGGKGNVQIVRNGIPCRGIETCPVCNGGKGAMA